MYLPSPVFSHGQLYVALSRSTSFAAVRVLVADYEDKQRAPRSTCPNPWVKTLNIVDRALLASAKTIVAEPCVRYLAPLHSGCPPPSADPSVLASLKLGPADVPCSAKILSVATNVLSTSDIGHDDVALPSDEPKLWSPLSHFRGMCCSDLPSGSVARPSRHNVASSVARGAPRSSAPVAWSDRYFEHQADAHCGMHALNNLLGGPQFIPADLTVAAAQVMAETNDPMPNHVAPGGWYSHSVLGRVLQNTVPPRWTLRFSPLLPYELPSFTNDPASLGALQNQGNLHWVAIVKHADSMWLVDSLGLPRQLPLSQMKDLLRTFPSTYPLVLTESLPRPPFASCQFLLVCSAHRFPTIILTSYTVAVTYPANMWGSA